MVERSTELRHDIEDTRDHLGDTLEAIGDRVSPGRVVERRWNRARSSVTNVRERVMGRSSDSAGALKGRVSGATEAVSGTVSDSASTVTDAVRHAPQSLQESTQGSPLLAGGIAFGVGFLIASLTPPSEAEKSMAGAIAEPLKQELTDIGHEVGDTAQGTAKEAVAATKEATSGAADEVKTQAQEAAAQVKSEAQEAKDTVAGQAQDAAKDVRDKSTGGP